jgi:cellulose biosynthesis protein BcsQ
MRVFAAYNIKGGVGKTATAVNLAYLSAREGVRTLVWDLDPQGAATFYFRVKAKVKGGGKGLIEGRRELDHLIRGTDFEYLDLLPADFSYRKMDLALDQVKNPARRLARLLQPMEESYDHLFIDCPPNITLVSESVFVATDALLVPTIPTTLSLRTLERLRKHLRKHRFRHLRLMPFFCMVDRRKGLHRRTSDDPELRQQGLLETAIPYSSVVEQMGLRRRPLATFAGSSPAALAYEALWREITATLNGTEVRTPGGD